MQIKHVTHHLRQMRRGQPVESYFGQFEIQNSDLVKLAGQYRMIMDKGTDEQRQAVVSMLSLTRSILDATLFRYDEPIRLED